MSLCMSVTSIVGGEFFLALTATKLEFWMFFFHMNVHPKLCEDCLITNGTHNSFHFTHFLIPCLAIWSFPLSVGISSVFVLSS